MSKGDFPYCIPDKRDLTPKELAFLNHLLKQVDGIDVTADELKVVARCGCGKCLTILLGRSVNDAPIMSPHSHPVMDWLGRADNGTLIGIGLFAKGGMPTELEAWSEDGGDIETWPPIEVIQRL